MRKLLSIMLISVITSTLILPTKHASTVYADNKTNTISEDTNDHVESEPTYYWKACII